jgi:hypothetical protein
MAAAPALPLLTSRAARTAELLSPLPRAYGICAKYPAAESALNGTLGVSPGSDRQGNPGQAARHRPRVRVALHRAGVPRHARATRREWLQLLKAFARPHALVVGEAAAVDHVTRHHGGLRFPDRV